MKFEFENATALNGFSPAIYQGKQTVVRPNTAFDFFVNPDSRRDFVAANIGLRRLVEVAILG